MTTYAETEFNLTSMTVNGVSLPMKVFDDIDYKFWYTVPDDMNKRLHFLKEFKVRENDVFICTYPKSGTNWIHEIVYMLLHQKSDHAPLFSVIEQAYVKGINKMESPRLYCSHLPFRYLPQELAELGRMICVVRNPKDTIVSLHHHLSNLTFGGYEGTFGQLLDLFLDGQLPGGSWFGHIMDWEKVPQENPKCSHLTVHYEDIKKNLVESIAKICKFLKLELNEELIAEIAQKCEFTNLQKEKSANISPIQKRMTKNCDNVFYRKGIVGDWKNWFTVAQNERFDSIFKDRMKESKLKFDLTI